MDNQEYTYDLPALLRFPFRQEGWEGKLGIGVGLLLASFFVPFIPAVFVYGYLIRVMRGAIDRGELGLPEWEDWGGLFSDGLRALVVGVSFLLPGIIVLTLGTCMYCGSFAMLPFVEGGGASAGASEGVFTLWLMFVMMVFFISLALGSVLSLLGAVPIPVAAASMATEERLGAAYRLRNLVRAMAANPMSYFGAWVVFFGLNAILYLGMTIAYYTLFLACLFPLLASPLGLYALLVAAGQFGLAYRESRELLRKSGGSEED